MKYQSLIPNVGVKSVNETVKFYTEVLSFNLIASIPQTGNLQWAALSNGNAIIMFQEFENLKEEYPELKDHIKSTTITFHIQMRKMDELYEKIKDTEYFAQELHVTPYGTQEFVIYDNNHFILTFSEEKRHIDTIGGYDNFFIPVDDYQESKQFYMETLGLNIKFEFEEQGMIGFAVGDEEPAIVLKDKKKFPEAKPSLWIEVENTQIMYLKLKDKGVKFVTKPFKIRTGWAVEFIDPSGNLLGFADYKK